MTKNEGAPLSSNNLVLVFHSGLVQGVANPRCRDGEIGSDSFRVLSEEGVESDPPHTAISRGFGEEERRHFL